MLNQLTLMGPNLPRRSPLSLSIYVSALLILFQSLLEGGRGKGGIRWTAWELEEGDVCRYSQCNFVLDLGSVIVAEHT